MFGESLPVSENERLEGGEVDVVQIAAAEAVDEMFEEVGWVGWLRVGEGEEGRFVGHCGCLRGVWERVEVVFKSPQIVVGVMVVAVLLLLVLTVLRIKKVCGWP